MYTSTIKWLSATLVLAATGCSSQPREPSPDVSPTIPLVSLDHCIHSIGTIPEGNIEETFKFRNEHQIAVRLQPPVTSCACNKVTYSTEEVGPGETLVVKANFNGKARPGLTRSHFQIPWETNQATGTVNCVIEATIEMALNLQPATPEIDSINGAKSKVIIEQRHGHSKPTTVWSNRSEITSLLTQIDDTHWEINMVWQDQVPDETRLPPLVRDGAVLIVYTEGIGHQQYRIPVRIRHHDEFAITSNNRN